MAVFRYQASSSSCANELGRLEHNRRAMRHDTADHISKHDASPIRSATFGVGQGMLGHRRMIAVAFGPATMAEAIDGLPRIAEEADCVELRLDLFAEAFDLAVLLREREDLPTVVTLRPLDEGGESPLLAHERLEVLLRAAEL